MTEKEFLRACLKNRELVSEFLATMGKLGDQAFFIAVDAESAPDAVGEYLRAQFFATDPNDDWSFGCYSAFDWAEGVEPLPDLHVEEQACAGCEKEISEWRASGSPVAGHVCTRTYEADWTRAQKKFAIGTIECRYFWDGDGTLAFRLPNGRWLVNSDCKCNYDWKIHESEEEF